jgi:hypothetical protein
MDLLKADYLNVEDNFIEKGKQVTNYPRNKPMTRSCI